MVMVNGLATAPESQGRGYASALVRVATRLVRVALSLHARWLMAPVGSTGGREGCRKLPLFEQHRQSRVLWLARIQGGLDAVVGCRQSGVDGGTGACGPREYRNAPRLLY